jgi:delta-aminolevulinic acid dehydratase/porphobilinogen synthase
MEEKKILCDCILCKNNEHGHCKLSYILHDKHGRCLNKDEN